MNEQRVRISGDRWLMLVHQLPATPAYLRVKIWRRLQGLGAISVKNSVYVLPASADTQEDFEWLLREIQDGGGEAIVCDARLLDGITDREVRELFDRARNADYAEIAKEAREVSKGLARNPSRQTRSDLKVRLSKLRARLAQVHAIDFFGAHGHQAADGLLSGAEKRLHEFEPAGEEVSNMTRKTSDLGELKDRTWVTRRGAFVDRIGSAWLIRRFIDPEARFKFVSAKGYIPEPGELRFDMFEAEFTHEGDQCSFEVLVGRAGLKKDHALRRVAEIVHDIDLKDGKFSRPEAEGIKALITGICNSTQDDDERVVRGSGIFEELYRSFEGRKRHS
jgi:hypothetical protein